MSLVNDLHWGIFFNLHHFYATGKLSRQITSNVVYRYVMKMNNIEKSYSLLAIFFALGLVSGIIFCPELRSARHLIPATLIGLAVNIGLMFVVLRDIFLRRFRNQSIKFVWLALVLILWPSVIYYLLRHGFKPRLEPEKPVPTPWTSGLNELILGCQFFPCLTSTSIHSIFLLFCISFHRTYFDLPIDGLLACYWFNY